MMSNDSRHIDEMMLIAFVDGELEAEEYDRVVRAMEADPALRAQVEELRRAGDLMQLGYGFADAPACTRGFGRRWRLSWNINHWAAGLLIFFVTALVAGVGGYQAGKYRDDVSASTMRRVVLHVSESSPTGFAAALEYTRRFVRDEPPGSQIAVVANAGGLDLLREDVSAFREEVSELISRYNQVHFIACANSIRSLKEKGDNPRIIEHVDASLPAFDQIVHRLEAGWSYRKLDSIPVDKLTWSGRLGAPVATGLTAS